MSVPNSVTLTEVFLVTYSIFYGIMLNACIGQNLFPYGQIGMNEKAKWRVFTSFFLINVGPIVTFAVLFNHLKIITNQPNFANIIGVFLISMIVFSFHRFLQAIIVCKPTLLYQECERKRIFKNPPLERQNWGGHLLGVIIYIGLLLLGEFLIYHC